jgi:hypothetical protein
MNYKPPNAPKGNSVPSVLLGLCHHLSEASPHARSGGSMARPHAMVAWRTKTALSQATCHHLDSESLTFGATCRVRKSPSPR